MAFPLAIICLFIGSTLIWVGSHGTNASTPWELFQQVISGLSGDAAPKTESADVGPATDPADTSGGRFGDTTQNGG